VLVSHPATPFNAVHTMQVFLFLVVVLPLTVHMLVLLVVKLVHQFVVVSARTIAHKSRQHVPQLLQSNTLILPHVLPYVQHSHKQVQLPPLLPQVTAFNAEPTMHTILLLPPLPTAHMQDLLVVIFAAPYVMPIAMLSWLHVPLPVMFNSHLLLNV
jgi:hypothetical protein